MQVNEVMSNDVRIANPRQSIREAAQMMAEIDAGVLPVGENDRLVGMITDRDICMAAAMRDRNPSGISVEEVMTGQVYAVNPEDNVDQALQLMQEHRIRRLPVINPDGELEGMLSMNDVVLNARGKGDSIAYRDVVKTYQAICQHPAPGTASATAGM